MPWSCLPWSSHLPRQQLLTSLPSILCPNGCLSGFSEMPIQPGCSRHNSWVKSKPVNITPKALQDLSLPAWNPSRQTPLVAPWRSTFLHLQVLEWVGFSLKRSPLTCLLSWIQAQALPWGSLPVSSTQAFRGTPFGVLYEPNHTPHYKYLPVFPP